MSEEIIAVGKQLLKAYALTKAGQKRTAASCLLKLLPIKTLIVLWMD